jgi:hypothetical protein
MQNLTQEQLGALVLRMLEERLRLADLDDLAGVHSTMRASGAQSPSRGSPPDVVPSMASLTMVSSTFHHLRPSAEVGSSNSMICCMQAKRARTRAPLGRRRAAAIFVGLFRNAHAQDSVAPFRRPPRHVAHAHRRQRSSPAR